MPNKKYFSLFSLAQFCSICVVLLLGIWFRFTNIEDKIFWVDEVATAVRVSGYTMSEVTTELQAKEIVTPQDLLQYQVINKDRDLIDTWKALTKSPEHAPLYFLLTRLWLQVRGNSIAIMRSLSVWFGLLILPGLYWLYRELFNKPFISRLGIMLMCVSPFYVAYAQEARPYSLWTVTILLMSASLLRAIRINNWQSWATYVISLVLGFYTSLLSLFIASFQGLYLLLVGLKNKQQKIKNYCISYGIAIAFFSPWLYIIVSNLQTLENNTSWMRSSIDPTALVATWIGTILLIFGDLPLSPDTDAVQMAIVVILLLVATITILYLSNRWNYFNKFWQKFISYFSLISVALIVITAIYLRDFIAIDIVTLIGAIVAVCILSLSSYALYFIVKSDRQKQWLFIACLFLALPIPLLLADLISQGQSSGAPRYLIPTQLAIQIAAAYTIGNKINYGFYRYKNIIPKTEKKGYFSFTQQQKAWSLVLVFFLTLGIFSCIRNLNLSPIYLKSRSVHNIAIAEVINYQTKPLVIVEPELVNDILSIAHHLSPQVRIKAIYRNDLSFLKERDRFSHLYLLKPSPQLKERLIKDSQIDLQLAYQPPLLTSKQIALNLWEVNHN